MSETEDRLRAASAGGILPAPPASKAWLTPNTCPALLILQCFHPRHPLYLVNTLCCKDSTRY